MKRFAWIIVTILALSISGYAVVQYFILGANKSGFILAKVSFGDVLNQLWYIILYIHAFTSLITLAIGPFLLSSKIRIKNKERHKRIGKVYYLCLLFGGFTGLYLAFEATGGIISTLGFGFLSIFWLVTAGIALVKIKKGQVHHHRRWMIRNYSLTFAAVTLRFWLLIFVLIAGIDNYETSYIIISWLCWIPNILIAEFYVNKSGKSLEESVKL
ncbi:DUF2306 domain-containing protein [Niallia taxi]|uniref:DUF2306 domain-containing protein n=1 Tax=Niallia taxi TaxID=2499688 RepID=UPI002E1D62E3|nr:DUF2306 domain-containing protein [Niallia taxi]